MISWYERKGFFSKFKDVYIKRFNIKRFWSNLKINKIDQDLKIIVDSYLSSDSHKFSSKYWDKLNINTLDQINNLGVEKFHNVKKMPTQIVFYDEVRRGKSIKKVDININPKLKPVD